MMINVNGEYMGNATTDIDGCFGFPSFNAELLAYERERESTIKEDKSWADLDVFAYYAEEELSTMYTPPFHLSLHPSMRRQSKQAARHTTTPQNQQNNGKTRRSDQISWCDCHAVFERVRSR